MDEFNNGQSSGNAAASAATDQGGRQENEKKTGVQDVNGDGKVDFKDYVATAAKAASDACQDAAAVIKEKAPQFAQKAKDVAGDVKDAFVEAAETVKEKTPEYVQKTKDAFANVFDHKEPAAAGKDDASAAPQSTKDSTQNA